MKSPDKREYTNFWIDSDLDGLELLHATYYTFSFAPHVHETYAIGTTEYGAQMYTQERKNKLVMPAGTISIVHPNELHTSQAVNEKGWSYRMAYPAANLLQQIASDISGHTVPMPFFSSPVIKDLELAERIRHFHYALENNSITSLERQSAWLSILGALILRHASTYSDIRKINPEPIYIRKVCEYMQEHFAKSITLDEIASQVGMSQFHFLRVFRNTIGLTPHAYLTHLRIEHAKRLLRHRVPLAAIAAETGFVDQSHFNKQFKKIIGVPPGQYFG
jgi:AraC-like DNA-binding protein